VRGGAAKQPVAAEEGILARLVRALVSRYVAVDAETFLAETTGNEAAASTESSNETAADSAEEEEGRSSNRRRRRGGRRARARRSTPGTEEITTDNPPSDEPEREKHAPILEPEVEPEAAPVETLVYPGPVPHAQDWHQMLVVTTAPEAIPVSLAPPPVVDVEEAPPIAESLVVDAILPPETRQPAANPNDWQTPLFRPTPTVETVETVETATPVETATGVETLITDEAGQQSLPLDED
jgi:ribonuclease E